MNNPAADCGHHFLDPWNGERNPFPIPCAHCKLTRCWGCPPCHDENGLPTGVRMEENEIDLASEFIAGISHWVSCPGCHKDWQTVYQNIICSCGATVEYPRDAKQEKAELTMKDLLEKCRQASEDASRETLMKMLKVGKPTRVKAIDGIVAALEELGLTLGDPFTFNENGEVVPYIKVDDGPVYRITGVNLNTLEVDAIRCQRCKRLNEVDSVQCEHCGRDILK